MINYKEILEYFLHEVTQLNFAIKTSSEILSKQSNDKNAISHHSEIIHENSHILSTLIDVINYKLNPELENIAGKGARNLHGKFKKVSISLKRRLKDKQLKFSLGELETNIDLYPIFDTLPYLLVDNAIKYACPSSEITVQFIDCGNNVQIEIENEGPKIFDEEKEKLFNPSYRGENARKMDIQGSGLGLGFAKQICELHKANVRIELGTGIYNLNGMDYQTFKVIIDLPKQ